MAARPCCLVVDDEAPIREALVEVLRDEGWLVRSADSGITALEMLRTHAEPQMVLLDSSMPGMSGEEFLAQVALDAGLTARIRVVCFSGGTPIATPPAIVVAVLSKPSRIAELVEALEKGARELG